MTSCCEDFVMGKKGTQRVAANPETNEGDLETCLLHFEELKRNKTRPRNAKNEPVMQNDIKWFSNDIKALPTKLCSCH